MFRDIDYKSLAIFIAACSAISAGISYFFDISFVTATLAVAFALMVNGFTIYVEDLEPGGFDHQPGVTDTPEARKGQRKAMKQHGAIIAILFLALIWSVL